MNTRHHSACVATHAAPKPRRHAIKAAAATLLLSIAVPASAEIWSDTNVGIRYGTKFAEPYGNTDITKTIINFQHTGGYAFGTNFFNIDVLLSDSKDPGSGTSSGAQEVYVVYRNTIAWGGVTKTPVAFGPIKDIGLTLGFDLNTKNDGYGSKKRMLVGGPTLMFAVPGFFNIDLLALRESNAPNGVSSRYYYDTHPALGAEWGITLWDSPVTFEGYALYIASKGKNEFGGATKPETHVDAMLMLDVGKVTGRTKNTLKVGIEYEYWKNKFGNPTTSKIGPGAGPGATAKTPMLRAEYHF